MLYALIHIINSNTESNKILYDISILIKSHTQSTFQLSNTYLWRKVYSFYKSLKTH